MSLIKFELKEDHVKLVRFLKWGINEQKMIVSGEQDDVTPFGGDDLYEEIGVILFGKPENFDPFGEEIYEWPEDKKKYMDEIYSELPTALSVILYTGSFELGHYKTKYHFIDWKKYTPKQLS